jgi:hypothetical protein
MPSRLTLGPQSCTCTTLCPIPVEPPLPYAVHVPHCSLGQRGRGASTRASSGGVSSACPRLGHDRVDVGLHGRSAMRLDEPEQRQPSPHVTPGRPIPGAARSAATFAVLPPSKTNGKARRSQVERTQAARPGEAMHAALWSRARTGAIFIYPRRWGRGRSRRFKNCPDARRACSSAIGAFVS